MPQLTLIRPRRILSTVGRKVQPISLCPLLAQSSSATSSNRKLLGRVGKSAYTDPTTCRARLPQLASHRFKEVGYLLARVFGVETATFEPLVVAFATSFPASSLAWPVSSNVSFAPVPVSTTSFFLPDQFL